MWMMGERFIRTQAPALKKKLTWWSRPDGSESESESSWCRSLNDWIVIPRLDSWPVLSYATGLRVYPSTETFFLSAKQFQRAFQVVQRLVYFNPPFCPREDLCTSNWYHPHLTTRWSWPLRRGIIVHVSQPKEQAGAQDAMKHCQKTL